jgi:glutamyl-tRNA synthetase
VSAVVDDFVLRRADGTPAYNLAVVVDDAAQGVEEVVRGDDLLLGTPRQVHLARLLDLPVPAYAHVPLVLAPSGERLAKRDGAVTMADHPPEIVRGLLASSIGLTPGPPADLVAQFDPDRVPREPWVVPGSVL